MARTWLGRTTCQHVIKREQTIYQVFLLGFNGKNAKGRSSSIMVRWNEIEPKYKEMYFSNWTSLNCPYTCPTRGRFCEKIRDDQQYSGESKLLFRSSQPFIRVYICIPTNSPCIQDYWFVWKLRTSEACVFLCNSITILTIQIILYALRPSNITVNPMQGILILAGCRRRSSHFRPVLSHLCCLWGKETIIFYVTRITINILKATQKSLF